MRSQALADSIVKISGQLSQASGNSAMNYMLSNAYVKALQGLNKPSKNIVMKANLMSPSAILKEMGQMEITSEEDFVKRVQEQMAEISEKGKTAGKAKKNKK